jgi:hypothetical protein
MKTPRCHNWLEWNHCPKHVSTLLLTPWLCCARNLVIFLLLQSAFSTLLTTNQDTVILTNYVSCQHMSIDWVIKSSFDDIFLYYFKICLLASKFLEEIISALQTKKCLLKEFLGLLLAPQLESLDLRYLSKEDFNSCAIDLELNLLRCIVRYIIFIFLAKTKIWHFYFSVLKKPISPN